VASIGSINLTLDPYAHIYAKQTCRYQIGISRLGLNALRFTYWCDARSPSPDQLAPVGWIASGIKAGADVADRGSPLRRARCAIRAQRAERASSAEAESLGHMRGGGRSVGGA
jgi:hypothetical protein